MSLLSHLGRNLCFNAHRTKAYMLGPGGPGNILGSPCAPDFGTVLGRSGGTDYLKVDSCTFCTALKQTLYVR